MERRGENRKGEKLTACAGNRIGLAHRTDTGGGNPHAHIMLTMRPFEQGGKIYKVKQSTTSIKLAWAWVNATDFLYVLVPKKDFVR
ncbi:hypothetical protein M2145_002758 [Lachnospiraceae bacterium PF1-21]|uniref:MobA/MobL family protein n=1 Tax=Ohessyouella blattaphilus TaxID=2949333 RepID=A0ABT1EKU6_9FIRM|nr:MobA/MobL family protein [Ohessyouella blattaphilus]MCP1111325.1 MobA/MobL family protein [Ohessyouella blattaphilus]MCR8564719.1 MobA/MobL family protein [Ohessyouella blattaphilus]